MLPKKDLHDSRGNVVPQLLGLYQSGHIIVIPPEVPSICYNADDPCSLVAQIYKLDPEKLRLECISLSTYKRILALFRTTNAQRATASGRSQLPLDDLIVVFEAKRTGLCDDADNIAVYLLFSDGCLISGDHFRDLVKYEPGIKQYIHDRRIEVR